MGKPIRHRQRKQSVQCSLCHHLFSQRASMFQFAYLRSLQTTKLPQASVNTSMNDLYFKKWHFCQFFLDRMLQNTIKTARWKPSQVTKNHPKFEKLVKLDDFLKRNWHFRYPYFRMCIKTMRWFIFVVTVLGVDSPVKLSVNLEPGLCRYDIKSPETYQPTLQHNIISQEDAATVE